MQLESCWIRKVNYHQPNALPIKNIIKIIINAVPKFTCPFLLNILFKC